MVIERFPLINKQTLLPVTEINTILFSHLLYSYEPEDTHLFWTHYPYFDPDIPNKDPKKYHFLELAHFKIDSPSFRKKLNHYLNIKFNPIEYHMPLDYNITKFKNLAEESSKILQIILERASLPEFVQSVFQENKKIASTNDIIDLIAICQKSESIREKYEITRKVGLTFLLSRVKNCIGFQKTRKYHTSVDTIFKEQLKIKENGSNHYQFEIYYWLDHNEKLAFYADKETAIKLHEEQSKIRESKGKDTHPLQFEFFKPQMSQGKNQILKYISRIKNFNLGREDNASVIEKIIRKNLLYPTEIADLYGITFVVNTEKELLNLRGEIESFLGGTNTRKSEKIIEKSTGSEYYTSTNSDFFKIWKTVYDITLPHERLEIINQVIKDYLEDIRILEEVVDGVDHTFQDSKIYGSIVHHLNRKYSKIEKIYHIKERLIQKPFDLQVEIQIQDLHSYLLSKCFGSSTEHEALKRNQVLSSTLYKVFPKKIYQPELLNLKENFLSKYAESKK